MDKRNPKIPEREMPHNEQPPARYSSSRVNCDENPSVENFFDMMEGTVWMIQARNQDGLREYDVYGGVCISRDGLILTSSKVDKRDIHGLEGRTYNTDKSYRRLVVIMVDHKSGWGLVRVKESGKEESFKHASISNRKISPGCRVMCIGHPDEINFSCLMGRTTHPCRFDPKNLRDTDKSAFFYQSTYLNVEDVMSGFQEEELDFSLGPASKGLPVLTIQGIFYCDGLPGSPIFDATGLLIGLVWFGDKLCAYCIPTRTIIHGLSVVIPNLHEVVAIEEAEGEEEGK